MTNRIWTITLLWIITTTGTAFATTQEPDAKPAKRLAFEDLLEKDSLDKWRGYKQKEIGKGWSVKDGVLAFEGKNGGDIVTKDEYRDFELQFKWKVTEGANSGVFYRVTLGDPASYFSGVEYQILDDNKHADGKNKKTSAGSIYALFEPKQKTLAKVGEWNTAKIVHKKTLVEHWLNGSKIAAVKIGSDAWNEQVKNSKFRDWKKFGVSKKGRIALQDHGNKVWFKEIKIRKLKSVTFDIFGMQNKARTDAAKMNAQVLSQACQMYKLNAGSYPKDLKFLVEKPDGMKKADWGGPFVESLSKDPWGNDFVMKMENDQPTIVSLGPDCKIDTEDDISIR